jgi:hypothetical protein
MIFTGLFASTHGPAASVATEMADENDFASCVSFTDGRA